MSPDRRFVVVSGLPGSGKSSLALRLAPLLGLPITDKDDILERLFELRGIGDANWRRRLSRESDLIFQWESENSAGGLLVSHWHLPGMPVDAGTPTEWLARLSTRIVNVHCECPIELAAARYRQRKRHRGHLDYANSPTEILESIRALASLQRAALGERVSVNTSVEIDLVNLIERISRAFDLRPSLAVRPSRTP
jgi:glucokinase